MLSLFDFELKENTEPEDATRIKLVNLYFSEEEKARFNELCKRGMLAIYGDKAKEANAVDFMLHLLEMNFGDLMVVHSGYEIIATGDGKTPFKVQLHGTNHSEETPDGSRG